MNNTVKELEKRRKKYAKEWSVDANNFYNNNYYKWMENLIKDYKRVIEIGCGNGNSTLELCNAGHTVISIDENIECLKLTKEKLESSGYKVLLIKRESLLVKSEKKYIINYSKIDRIIDDGVVVLVQGDIIGDNNLVKWLEDNKPYDAIVCWLIGTHGFRRFNEAISEKNLVTPGDYRFAVQNRVYEKADELLRKDGVLQIVDRCETPNKDEIRNSFLESHRDQASVTSLLVTSLEYLEYDTNIENGAKMNVSTGNQITITDKIPNMSFISVTSVKP